MGNVRSVRKFHFEGEPVCIANELIEYINISTPLNRIIKEKNMEKGYDFEILPRHLLDSKVNLERYKNANEVVLLKQSGILKILNNRRQTESIDIARVFGVNLSFIKEREYLNIIKGAFQNYNCTQQYFVPKEDKNGYFIDLYIQGEDKNIAVEVDENGHNSYDSEFEIEREKYIKEKLGCDFIRFNPDDKSFNIGKVINKIMNTKSKKVNQSMEYIDDSCDSLIYVNEIIDELNQDNPSIKEFVEILEIENIHNDLGSKISYNKSIYNDEELVIMIDNEPIMNTKDILKQYITIEESKCLNVIVGFYSNIAKKTVRLHFKIVENKIHIKLLDGLRKVTYIKEYLERIK